MRARWITLLPFLLLVACASTEEPDPGPPPTREEAIPDGAVKMTPETDHFPPRLVAGDFSDPEPLAGPVNTAGVEDAPVITADGGHLLFFFTPDGNIPAEQQILDRVTGIWQSDFLRGEWSEPVRVLLHDDLSLDGPFGMQGDTLWFGSWREGNYGGSDGADIFTAVYDGTTWSSWQNAGTEINVTLDVGECWILPGGDQFIYDSWREGGLGRQDLWRVWREDEGWSDPENIGPPANTALSDSRPCISPDGQTLWFTYEGSSSGGPGPSVWRARREGDQWVGAEEIVTGFVGDPGVDAAGNLYFTHLFFTPGIEKIETDIYICRPR